jgi:hypothetical protein
MIGRPSRPWTAQRLALNPLPRALRVPVRHAETLAAHLGSLAPPKERLAACAWLFGRAQEVECFVLDVTRDLRGRRMSEGSAVMAIDAYLNTLHRGLARHFGERFPSCCAAMSSLAGALGACDSTPTVVYGAVARRAEAARSKTSARNRITARAAHFERGGPEAQTEDLLAGLTAPLR